MKNISALLLRREWTRYHSFGGSWLFIWGIYLVIFLLTGQSGSFFLVFLPMIMSYGALVTASQAGEAVLAGTEDFLLPVPLRRVIWARYQLVFLIGLASSLLCIIMLFLGRLLHPSDSFYSPVFLFGMGMLTAGASAVFVGPIIFRWEFGRSRVLNTLIIGLGTAVGAGSSALVIIASNGGGLGMLDLVPLLGAVLLWALAPVSCTLAEKNYRKGGVTHEKKPIILP